MHKNDFAPTPPMGWDSCTCSEKTIDEGKIKAGADYIARHLKKYGWEYIIINCSLSPAHIDCFGSLTNYIQRLGLKSGIHIASDIPCCQGRNHPSDSQAYYDSILNLCASMGADLIKWDSLSTGSVCRREPEMLSSALKRCSRPMILAYSPKQARLEDGWRYAAHTNMWQISGNLQDDFEAHKDVFQQCEWWQTHVRKGCYPDCGTLSPAILGQTHSGLNNNCFTMEEARSILTLRYLFGSPIMLSGDITRINEEAFHFLTNRKLLALLSPEYVPRQFSRDDRKAIWQADNIINGEHYVALFNLSQKIQTMVVPLHDLGYYSSSAKLTDLWRGNLASTVRGNISVKLAPHDCMIYKVEF